MDEPQRPPELSEDAWQATPLEVRQFIALLVAKRVAIEARLNQNSQNASKPPSSDPPSAPPRPAKTPRGKPKPKGAQPGHPDQQRDKGRWQADAADRLALANLVFAVWDRFCEGAIDRETLQAMLHPIQPAMWERMPVIQHDGHYLSSRCRERIRLWDALWTFVEVGGIEPTNNAAERALRPAVLWRNGRYGTQSDGGSRVVERMLTVSAPCQQHERPLFPYLIAAVTA